MEEALISIIVPVYQAEKHLLKCVKSIQNQTYKNLEIILINDGSTDKSGLICDELAKQDSRITVLHQKNRGVSTARNNGIECAGGEYIGFVDSDDYIEKDMYQLLYQNIQESGLDIAACGYDYVEPTGKIIEKSAHKSKAMNTHEAIKSIILFNEIGGVLWNKLFDKKIFKNYDIRLSEQIYICEDLLCVCECVLKGHGLIYNGNILYHYIKNMDSALHCSYNSRKLTGINAYENLRVILTNNGLNFNKEIKVLEIQYYLGLILQIVLQNNYDIRLIKKFQTFIRNNLFLALFNSILKIKDKIYIIAIICCPNFFYNIYRCLKNHKNCYG